MKKLSMIKFFFATFLVLIVIFCCQKNLTVYAATSNEAGFELFKKGIALHDEKKYKQAAETITRAIEISPNSDKIGFFYAYLGLCYGPLNEFQKASACFEKALEIDKKIPFDADLKLIVYKGVLFNSASAENYDKVIDYASKCIEELSPKDEDIYVLRGGAYFQKGMLQQALDDFNKAVEINPKNNDIRAMRRAVIEQMKAKKIPIQENK